MGTLLPFISPLEEEDGGMWGLPCMQSCPMIQQPDPRCCWFKVMALPTASLADTGGSGTRWLPLLSNMHCTSLRKVTRWMW